MPPSGPVLENIEENGVRHIGQESSESGISRAESFGRPLMTDWMREWMSLGSMGHVDILEQASTKVCSLEKSHNNIIPNPPGPPSRRSGRSPGLSCFNDR